MVLFFKLIIYYVNCEHFKSTYFQYSVPTENEHLISVIQAVNKKNIFQGMSSQSSSNDTEKVGESSSHNYNTRLSVKKSMSAFSGRDGASNSSENLASKTEGKESLLSIYRRKSTSSRGEVEGEIQVAKSSRTKFSIFRRLSSVSSAGEERNSGDFSEEKEGVQRGSSQTVAVERRRSLYLEHDGCEGTAAYQMNCGSFSRVGPSGCEDSGRRQQKICGILPCLIALGAIIIIVLPLTKILGSLKSELYCIHNEMTVIKKHVGIDTEKSKECAKLPKEYSTAIKDLVKEELENLGPDRVGKTDFALETAGGRIVKTVDTENYGTTVGLFGLTLCEGSNGPRAMIQSSSAPGECWAFKGSQGKVMIKLLGKVRINAISLEHIPRTLSPTGRLETAPKDFEIYGLECPKSKKILLGKFQYRLDSHPIQTFPIKNSCHVPFEFVEFHVNSNHGCAEYTCVYRLRVHGVLNSL